MASHDSQQTHPQHPQHPENHETPNPFAAPNVYYGIQSPVTRSDPKRRHFSAQMERGSLPILDAIKQHRRGSQDASGEHARQFLVPVDATLQELLAQEDTRKQGQITVDDAGPKVR